MVGTIQQNIFQNNTFQYKRLGGGKLVKIFISFSINIYINIYRGGGRGLKKKDIKIQLFFIKFSTFEGQILAYPIFIYSI